MAVRPERVEDWFHLAPGLLSQDGWGDQLGEASVNSLALCEPLGWPPHQIFPTRISPSPMPRRTRQVC